MLTANFEMEQLRRRWDRFSNCGTCAIVLSPTLCAGRASYQKVVQGPNEFLPVVSFE